MWNGMPSDKFNLGFDTVFDGRLSLVFDFYYDINDNILNQFMASQPGIPVWVRMRWRKILAVLIHMAVSCSDMAWQGRTGEL